MSKKNNCMKIWNLRDDDPFISGSDNFQGIKGKYIRLEDASIFFCLSGHAHISIDLQEYELQAGIQVILLPGCMLHVTSVSADFRLSFIGFSNRLFHEVTCRLDPFFFHFLKETPCAFLPPEHTGQFRTLALSIDNIYHDRNNHFRILIARNCIQSLMMDIYDKTQRLFMQPSSGKVNRQEELFKRFIQEIHYHCFTHREVIFYAERLHITPRYLSSIAQKVEHVTAKSIIDRHAITEIKTALKTTNLSIQELSHKMLFPDQSFFGRYFKKHTGMSPLQYRNYPD